jgi:hypothetical protein
VVPFLIGCLRRTPDTYHLAGIKRGTATSNFHVQRDNLTVIASGSLTASAVVSWTSFNIDVSLPAGLTRRTRYLSTWRVRRARRQIVHPQL